jgi:hypothetical protein
VSDVRPRREFFADGQFWTAELESGVAGGNMTPGELLEMPPVPGIHFRATDGEVRFLQLEYPELPTRRAFPDIEVDALRTFLQRAARGA